CQSVVPEVPLPTASASGTILFEDDFSSASTGWDRQQTAEGVMDYDAGGYRMLVNALETNFWSTPHKSFGDVRVEVDAGKLGGPEENRAGLLCRYTGLDYYFFMITHDGFYALGIFTGGQAVLLGQSEMQASSAIHTGVNINHLRADCVGDTLTFYVNGQELASAQDGTLTQGDVGLMTGTFGRPGVDMIFDNFVVIQP
ncbi:MAG: hypothetical protein ACREUU_10490, partial [Gammaproteobacteria bacterium]